MTAWEIPTEGVSEDGSVLLPEGVYYAEVSKVDTAPSKAGERMLTLSLKQVGGKHLLLDRLTFGDKARGLSIAKLYALGVPRVPPGGKLVFDPPDLIGKRAAILVVHSPGQGAYSNRMEARVASFNLSRDPFGLCGYCSEAKALELGIIGEAATSVATKEETPF